MIPPAGFAPIRFSSEDIPARDRVAVWREVIGRKIVRIDIEPLRDRPFRVDANLRALPDLGMMSADMSEFRLERTRGLIADGNSDLRFAVNVSGREIVVQRGREVTLDPGDAILVSMAETGGVVRTSPGKRLGFNIPLKVLAALVPDVEAAGMRRIPRDAPALRLLMSYVGVLRDEDALATPELRRLAASHIHDLVALAVGSAKDARAVAAGHGARAARLRAIIADITANLSRCDLSIDLIARRHHLGVRYVQRLFETEKTTFSDFVTGQRLSHARRMLFDPRLADQTIADIADACGFSDPSYFGRRFREFFGETPSDVRARRN
jgi:AraC-like DNA-binding protein